MSNIAVTNNTRLPIHIAMTWKGIVQYYHNDLKPGETHNFDKFLTGWSDFHAVIATEENRFNHDSDAGAILGLGAVAAGIVISVAGIALLPFSGGTSSAAVVAGIAIASTAGVISVAGAVIEGVEGILMPASVKALFVSDKYSISVEGGNIIGVFEEDSKTFTVTKVEPLSVHWKNEVSGNSGVETAPAA